MKRIFSNQFGFSLLEVLMALGVFDIAAATILPSISHQLQITQDDLRMTQGLFVAKNKMAEIETEIATDQEKGKFPDEVTKSGRFESPYEDYSWEYAIRKVEIPLADTGGEGQSAIMGNVVKTVMKDISRSVRELKLTVRWWDENEDEEAVRPRKEIVLTTHIVNFKP